MASIRLFSESTSTDTLVPNRFIEEYMPEATGEFVKVYLFLLHSIQSKVAEFSISQIADSFNHTEKDILRAIKYWERQGLITIDYNQDKTIGAIYFVDISSPAEDTIIKKPSAPSRSVAASAQPEEEQIVPVVAVQSSPEIIEQAKPEKREFSLDEIKQFRQDPEISEMIFIIETYLKHTLNSSDLNFVLFWLEELHFVPELVEYLVEYCISKGHSSLRYMDKVAISWANQDITTVEQARENAAIHSQAYYAVMKALGISGRNLADSESALVNKWSKEFGFDINLIQEACKRTIAATHQPSFEYTDSILSNWHKNKVHTLTDVSKLDESFSKSRKLTVQTSESVIPPKRGSNNKFKNFNQRSYDVDQLEKVLLTTSVQ